MKPAEQALNCVAEYIAAEDHDARYWKDRALEWMRIADSEAQKCRQEYKIEIAQLRTKVRMLQRLLDQKARP